MDIVLVDQTLHLRSLYDSASKVVQEKVKQTQCLFAAIHGSAPVVRPRRPKMANWEILWTGAGHKSSAKSI